MYGDVLHFMQGGAGRGDSGCALRRFVFPTFSRVGDSIMATKSSTDGAKDPSDGQSNDAVGNANANAGRPGAVTDALDNGNSGPTSGSLDANLAAQRDADARAALSEQGKTREPNEPVRIRLESGPTASAPTPNLDKTIPGGRTIRADGVLQNAHGMEIDEEGGILDTPHNRSVDPRRFSGVPL